MIRQLSTSRALFLRVASGNVVRFRVQRAGNGEESGTGSIRSSSRHLAHSASLENFYDGPNAWGTIQVKNVGPSAASGYVVQFDVPSGAHCTNDTRWFLPALR